MLRKLCAGFLIVITVVQLQAFAQVQSIGVLALSPILEKIQTPKQLSKFMSKNFKFVEDPDNFNKIDYWQSPEEMLANKKGDCEDFALFAAAALKDLGYESQVVSMYGTNGFAHTVAVYKEEGKYRVFNDGKLYKYDTETIEEALSEIYGEWQWAALTERKNDRGQMNEIFYNPAFQPQSKI